MWLIAHRPSRHLRTCVRCTLPGCPAMRQTVKLPPCANTHYNSWLVLLLCSVTMFSVCCTHFQVLVCISKYWCTLQCFTLYFQVQLCLTQAQVIYLAGFSLSLGSQVDILHTAPSTLYHAPYTLYHAPCTLYES